LEDKMRALSQKSHGSTEVLKIKDFDLPIPDADEVLVRVGAASVGAWDAHAMTGEPRVMGILGLLKPKNTIAGLDLAGCVESVGDDVTQFKPGDEVYGEARGSIAEFTIASVDSLALKPRNLTTEEAAAVPVAGITALTGLRDVGQVSSGQSVLIIGASGGVGTFAVQIAKAMGATVTGVASTRNLDLVRSIGADHVIDYTDENFAELGVQYDVILELADTRSLSELRRAMVPKGTLVMSSGVGGRWFGPLGRYVKSLIQSLFVSQRVRVLAVKTTAKMLDDLTEMIESGAVVPVIDRTYSFSDAAEAVGYVTNGHTRGKTIITIG
jgi:NADPH:quinone reductase-like Zn-dependent oxidoreductase